VREKEDLFTEGESRIEELNNRIARSQEKIAELEEENENQRLEDKETIEIIKGENKILTRELEKKRKEKLQHEKEISDLNHNIVELNQAIVEISAYNEAEINGLKGLCEELEEKLEEERGIIETIGKVL
jgi:predicted  nucleic acid-binding Zn-ribbon protein